MISSTCFGQTFAHLQERKTEVFYSFLHTVHIVPRCRAPNPCPPQQQDIIPHVVKNLSLALLKMGKSLPETCWADHWRSIKLLLLHLLGFYFTLSTKSDFSVCHSLLSHSYPHIWFHCYVFKISLRNVLSGTYWGDIYEEPHFIQCEFSKKPQSVLSQPTMETVSTFNSRVFWDILLY